MRAQLTSLVIGVTMVAFGAPASLADNKNPDEIVRAQLVGFQEVPALSTPAGGQFKAVIDEDSGVITYTVSYENLVGLVQQAHIHFGQKGVNGGISVFLCSNLGNGPAGTPECPAAPAEVTGHSRVRRSSARRPKASARVNWRNSSPRFAPAWLMRTCTRTGFPRAKFVARSVPGITDDMRWRLA